MKQSARNVFKGTVQAIEVGAVNVDVLVEIAPSIEVSSIITMNSSEKLALEVGKEVIVVIKAQNVMIGVDQLYEQSLAKIQNLPLLWKAVSDRQSPTCRENQKRKYHIEN